MGKRKLAKDMAGVKKGTFVYPTPDNEAKLEAEGYFEKQEKRGRKTKEEKLNLEDK